MSDELDSAVSGQDPYLSPMEARAVASAIPENQGEVYHYGGDPIRGHSAPPPTARR